MSIWTKDQKSAKVRLLMEALHEVNRQTKLEVMMYENRLEILVGLVRDRFGIDNLADLFMHSEIDDEIKEAVQITLDELKAIKQARYDLSEELNQMIKDTLLKERSQ